MQYVLGFAFSRNKRDVLLIKKQKPEWQSGLYNGIGGKINEPNEAPIDAMKREFKEETGIFISQRTFMETTGTPSFYGWEQFATIYVNEHTVHCFRAYTNLIYQCTTNEIEEVSIHKVDKALNYNAMIQNLKVLIPMALDESFIHCEIKLK